MVFTPFVLSSLFVVVDDLRTGGIDLDLFGGNGQDLLYAAAVGGNLIQFRLRSRRILPVNGFILPDPAKNDELVVCGKAKRVFVVAMESKASGRAAL